MSEEKKRGDDPLLWFIVILVSVTLWKTCDTQGRVKQIENYIEQEDSTYNEVSRM